MRTLTASLILTALCAATACRPQSPHYAIAHTFPVEGDGGWDYLVADEINGRLFVSHGTQVNVIDEATGTSLGVIPDTKGVHGIALADDIGKGFISCGKDSSVVVFNIRGLTFADRVKVTGANPDAILYDAFTQRVFTFNGRSSNATVIDANTNAVLGTIALEGKPEFAVSDGAGKIYVNIEDKSLICEIDPMKMTVLANWPIAPGVEPSGLALDNATHRLFSVCDNQLMVVVDAQSGMVITTLPIGESVDGAAFDPATKRVFSSNGDGTLTVVQESDGDKFTVLENVVTQKNARTCTLDHRTHHIFLSTADRGPAPAATPENPKPRPSIKPGSFVVLDVEEMK